jgi:hypothetical protein
MSRRTQALTVLIGSLFVYSPPGLGAAAPAPAKVPVELLKERVEAARKTWQQIVASSYGLGLPTREMGPEDAYLWSRRWLEAERALNEKQADQVAACEAHLNRMKDLEKAARNAHEAKLAKGPWVVSAARFYRVEAEIWLAEARAK